MSGDAGQADGLAVAFVAHVDEVTAKLEEKAREVLAPLEKHIREHAWDFSLRSLMWRAVAYEAARRAEAAAAADDAGRETGGRRGRITDPD